jgi:hypothetical protein
MLLVSAAILAVCALLVILILRREKAAGATDASAAAEERGVGGAEALRLLRESRHLQLIAGVIGFAAVGAAIIEQQLNMSAAEAGGSKDAVAALLAQVILYASLIGFLVQVLLTSRVHRVLGIGFALLILPVSLGTSGILMLTVGAFWTAALARVLDTSLRYTIDKTSREVLFLPLPLDVKYRAKPFVDVSVDRFAKGLGALLILVLLKDWGFGLDWRQLSYASLTIMVLWVLLALRARREYLSSFRKRLEPGATAVAADATQAAALDPAATARLLSDLASSDENARTQAALDLKQVRAQHPEVTIDNALFERLMREECARAFGVLADQHVLLAAGSLDAGSGLFRALEDKRERALDAVFTLLALVHPPADIDAARAALKTSDPLARASSIEYIDNLLPRALRSRILVLIEDVPDEERFERGASLFRTPARGAPEILAELERDQQASRAV